MTQTTKAVICTVVCGIIMLVSLAGQTPEYHVAFPLKDSGGNSLHVAKVSEEFLAPANDMAPFNREWWSNFRDSDKLKDIPYYEGGIERLCPAGVWECIIPEGYEINGDTGENAKVKRMDYGSADHRQGQANSMTSELAQSFHQQCIR